MAAKDLEGTDFEKKEELEDITTCIICTEVYTDPKALPCLHTFCMTCIQETGIKTNKGPGDEMPCPICRRMFRIPAEGFPGLPKHFFIERLIQLSKIAHPNAVTKVLCSLCLEDSTELTGKEIPTAITFCVDCKHHLCEECSSEHKKFKLTKNHKLIPMSERGVDKNKLKDVAPYVCEVHEQTILDVYCADCKTVVCAICFIEDHSSHKGSHVNKCVGGFRKQIQKHTETISGCISLVQTKKTDILEVKKEIQEKMDNLESGVVKRKNEVKQLVDNHANCLLQSLSSERGSRLKHIQMSTDDIDAYLSNLESYNSYCQKIMAEGSAGDICRAFSDLSLRTSELQQQCQPIIEIDILEFGFRQSELEELVVLEGFGNLDVEIKEEGDSKSRKTIKQILFTEQFKEMDILKQKNNELREKRDDYNKQLQAMKRELESNKTAMSELQVKTDKIEQELDAEKAITISIQTGKEKLNEELEKFKATLKTCGLETNVENLRKQLSELQIKYRSDPGVVLVQTIKTKAKEKESWPGSGPQIRGLTILDDELFVLSQTNSGVEVYDSTNFSFRRSWTLKEFIHGDDIASCNRNKCLYIMNSIDNGNRIQILRVDPNGKLINSWLSSRRVFHEDAKLHIADDSNVLLTISGEHTLSEYSPDGKLIREINLSSKADIQNPRHAIKLSSGHFVVSHGKYDSGPHRVCILDADGKLKKTFGGQCGSTVGQLHGPEHLVIDGKGFLIVVDRGNNRVLLLDSDLEFKREILSHKMLGLARPLRIILDEPKGLLFVAQSEAIFIFQ